MSFEILAYQNRTTDFNGSLYASDGVTPIQLVSTDALRFKMGRRPGSTPTIDLRSGSPTANGSAITITGLGSASANPPTPATYTVRLAQGDIDTLTPGPYDAELLFVNTIDTVPAVSTQPVSVGVVHVIPEMGGAVG